MFKTIALFTFVAAATSHSIPSSFQKVVIYHPVKHEAKVESWTEKPKAWEAKEWEPKEYENKGWEQKEPEAPANYDFKYEVHDEKTGDLKRQSETAVNGAVKGQYSLIDSDGFRRVVEYTADDQHGFQATVNREPTHYKISQLNNWETKAWEPKSYEHKGWEQKEPEAPANYDFKYEVHDEKTGDLKRQSETAVNGAVKGQYSLIDSDGFKRIVEYTADDHHGFQATVKREPTHYKIPQPTPKPIEEPKWW